MKKLKIVGISAFKKRSGICFDYSCLYVAMARAVNLKVRLLTGTAYDGEKYGCTCMEWSLYKWNW